MDLSESSKTTLLSYDQYEYRNHPLLFSKVSLSESKKLLLISKFNEWYGNTAQETTLWALEYEVIVRMLLEGFLVVNPVYLAIAEVKEEMDRIIKGQEHPPHTGLTASKEETPNFLLTIEEPYARDTQIYVGNPDNDEMISGEGWCDVKRSVLYLGIVTADNAAIAKLDMARSIGCSSEIITAQEI